MLGDGSWELGKTVTDPESFREWLKTETENWLLNTPLPPIVVESILQAIWSFSWQKIATSGSTFFSLENAKWTKNLVTKSGIRHKKIVNQEFWMMIFEFWLQDALIITIFDKIYIYA